MKRRTFLSKLSRIALGTCAAIPVLKALAPKFNSYVTPEEAKAYADAVVTITLDDMPRLPPEALYPHPHNQRFAGGVLYIQKRDGSEEWKELGTADGNGSLIWKYHLLPALTAQKDFDV